MRGPLRTLPNAGDIRERRMFTWLPRTMVLEWRVREGDDPWAWERRTQWVWLEWIHVREKCWINLDRYQWRIIEVWHSGFWRGLA